MKKFFSLLAIFLLFGSMTASASYYIVGTIAENGWDPNNATLMVNNEITYTLAPGDNQFKVLTTLGSWDNQLNYNDIDWTRTSATCEDEANDHNVIIVLNKTSYVHISIVNGMICVTATPVSNPNSNSNSVITYTATEKLREATEVWDSGLHTYAFDVSITSHTFADGTGTITFNGDVTSIREAAFDRCSSLTSITIPNSVTNIGERAFYGCSGLTSFTIPNSVTSIGSSAFAYCSSLTSITFPNSVTSIGYVPFANCSSLTSIVVESGNIIYDSRENCNAIIETSTNTLISGCQNTIIPNSVTSIGYAAFYYCSGLTSITIPNSVTSIGYVAFAYCSGLTSITIPNSVTSIGEGAFEECTKLRNITCYASEPPMVNQNTFSNYNINLNVPCDYIEEYKFHAVWGLFKYIQCIEEGNSEGFESTTIDIHTQKLLHNGQVIILRDGNAYNVQGVRVEE